MSTDHQVRATAPDLIDPIVGFRQWRITDGYLQSVYSNVRWQRSELCASCAMGNHDSEDSPAKACSCGIYAYYEPCPRTASAGTADFVGGAVVLWGRIELHAAGMRAQYARVVALELPLFAGRKSLVLRRVAHHLDVAAVRHSDLTAIALTHEVRLDRRMRPPRRFEPAGPGHGHLGILPRLTASVIGVKPHG